MDTKVLLRSKKCIILEVEITFLLGNPVISLIADSAIHGTIKRHYHILPFLFLQKYDIYSLKLLVFLKVKSLNLTYSSLFYQLNVTKWQQMPRPTDKTLSI